MRPPTKGSKLLEAIGYLIIVIILIFALFPIYWMIITSFKFPNDAMSFPPKFVPFLDFVPSLNTWTGIVFGYRLNDTLKALINSVFIASVSATIATLLGSLAGYGLSRFKFRKWKNRDILSFIIAQRMMPPIVALVPLYLMFARFGLLDTAIAIALIHAAFNLPLVVWIIKDFFDNLPIEVEEAALVDGASYATVLRRVVLPLVKPGLSVTWIFSFILSWNEFLTVLGIAYDRAITLTWLISTGHHVRALEWWTISAYGTLSIIPPLIFAAILQRYVIRGLTFGAVRA